MTRAIARLVWGSALVLPLAFLAVAATRRGPGAIPVAAPPLLLWSAIAASFAAIALAHALPPRLGPSRAGREATVLTRLAVAWALCEGAALFPAVAWMVTGDARLLGVFGVDLLAIVTLFPSERRLAALVPGDGPDEPGDRWR